jgi:hypothetical protein
MKKSTAAKVIVGGTSIAVAVACPPVGAALGGYYAVTAAAGMGTGAVVALGAAGVVGGGMIGSVAASVASIPAKVLIFKAAKKKVKSIIAKDDFDISFGSKMFKDAGLTPSFKKANAPRKKPDTSAPARKPNRPAL